MKKLEKRKTVASENGLSAKPAKRIPVSKTYKLFIGGQFPRTESGRYIKLEKEGKVYANICRASRKDFRNAVVAAQKALVIWSARSAFNRSQILYRIAEMMEGRKEEFTAELKKTSKQPSKASREVEQAIDRVVYYAGWCDKYQQIFSAVNPVASSHFNFSVLEPVGVVAGIAPEKGGLLGLISMLMPIIAGGNTIVVLASEESPQVAMTLAEVLNVADLPGGVVNILTGKKTELFSHFASHMEVNALALGEPLGEAGDGFKMTANNVKRVISYEKNWSLPQAQGPYFISDFQEVKTTWHPVEQTGAGKASY